MVLSVSVKSGRMTPRRPRPAGPETGSPSAPSAEERTTMAPTPDNPGPGPRPGAGAGADTGAKRPLSEARLAACRANGRRSRGPVTEDGKNASKYNGLTHGLRSELVVLPGEDPEEFEDLVEQLTLEQGAETLAECITARHAAEAARRHQRGLDAEDAAVRRAMDEVRQRARQHAEADAQQHAERIEEDPAGSLRGLLLTVPGCAWLDSQWELLGKRLERWYGLQPTDLRRAIHLLGKRPADVFHDREVYELVLADMGAWLNGPGEVVDRARILQYLPAEMVDGLDQEEVDDRFDLFLDEMPGRDRGSATLVALVEAKRAELAEHAALIAELEERNLRLA